MYSLPPELLLMITSVSCTIIMIFNAIFAKKVSNDGLDVWFYTAFTTLSAFISATIILIISNVNFYFSLFSVLISLIFSAMITLNTFATIKASKIGSLSYTSIIASLSCIIPTLISRFFFNETISIPQYIGMALIVVCIVLSTERDSANKKASIRKNQFSCGGCCECAVRRRLQLQQRCPHDAVSRRLSGYAR